MGRIAILLPMLPAGEAAKEARMPGGRHVPKKSLGQNFLVSEGTARRIAGAVLGSGEPPPVFEIGPGKGALTVPLARSGTQIAAFEIDRRLAEEAAAGLAPFPGAEIVVADIREVDLDAEAGRRGWSAYALAGNIPYLLTSTILLGLPRLKRCERAVIMMQREVGERVLASPGKRECGVLSVFLQAYMDVEKVMSVPAGAFRPRPKVDSVVLKFEPRPKRGAPKDPDDFLDLLKKAFSRRRKKMTNALAAWTGRERAEAAGAEAGVDMDKRPENLDLGDWFALYEAAARTGG